MGLTMERNRSDRHQKKSSETIFHNTLQDFLKPPHHDREVEPPGLEINRRLQLVGRGEG